VGLAFDGTPRPMASAIALAGLAAFVATQALVVGGRDASQR
jgi:hypothetical protein